MIVSLADMLRPSMQTLKHIVVNIDVMLYVDVDPLFGIPSALEDMRAKNIIETVTIITIIRIEQTSSRHGRDDWGRLDEVLTAPGWFSLKRVSLAIRLATLGNTRRYGEMEVELRKLLETQFPRLSSSNSVSFDLEVVSAIYMK
jgi:hypothetical protein